MSKAFEAVVKASALAMRTTVAPCCAAAATSALTSVANTTAPAFTSPPAGSGLQSEYGQLLALCASPV